MSAENLAKISPKQNVNQVSVAGKIDRFDVHEGKHYTEVIIPAADEYSNPGRVKVVSTRPLGAVGQPVTIDCSIRGYVHTFPITRGQRAGQQGREVKTWFVPVGDIS